MPDLYLAAMQHAFQRGAHLAAEGDTSGGEAEHAVFVALCSRVAVNYMGFNASAPSLERIAAGGIRYALQAVPQNLPFMEVRAFTRHRRGWRGCTQYCSMDLASTFLAHSSHRKWIAVQMTPSTQGPHHTYHKP